MDPNNSKGWFLGRLNCANGVYMPSVRHRKFAARLILWKICLYSLYKNAIVCTFVHIFVELFCVLASY